MEHNHHYVSTYCQHELHTATNLAIALESGTGTHFRGEDRAERLDRELLEPFEVAPGEFYDDVIVRLLQQAWRGVNPGDQCRLACKHCESRCLCPCHREPPVMA